MKQRYRLLFTLTVLLASAVAASAQVTTDTAAVKNFKPVMPDYRGVVGDSTVIPKSGQKQEKAYLEGTYNYPPKPRNKWEIGLHGGGFFLSSDVTSRGGWGAGLQVRKSLGYTLSLQGHYMHGTTYGQNWQSNAALANNPVLNGKKDTLTDYLHHGGKFFFNNKTTGDELSLNLLVTLNNIGFHKKAIDRKVNMIAGLGLGLFTYKTWYDALDANNQRYDFNSIVDPGIYTDRKAVYSALKGKLDHKYETLAEGQPDQPSLSNQTLDPVVIGTLGMSFHLSKNLNLNLTERFTITHDDLLDGQRWQEHDYQDPALTRDFDTYHYISLGLGYFIGGKHAVEPLYWQNPMDYTYDALNTLMKKNVDDLIDTDDDGVVDRLDKEPNTAPGATVDTHGVTLDSDKDGVPDYKDKEPFSVPGAVVDSNGVAIVKMDSTKMIGNTALCNLTAMPSVNFELDKYFIQPEFYAHLHEIAMAMIECPTQKMAAIGYTDVRNNDAYNDLLSWERVNACIDYLVNNYKIDRNRFLVTYKGERDPKYKGLPASGVNPKYESRQYVNRRVEFHWAGPNDTGTANPPRPASPSKAGKEF